MRRASSRPLPRRCAARWNMQPDEPVPLSYCGGVFNAGALILGPAPAPSRGQSGTYQIQAPMVTPSGGAAIYAAKLSAQPLSAAAIERLRNAGHKAVTNAASE